MVIRFARTALHKAAAVADIAGHAGARQFQCDGRVLDGAGLGKSRHRTAEANQSADVVQRHLQASFSLHVHSQRGIVQMDIRLRSNGVERILQMDHDDVASYRLTRSPCCLSCAATASGWQMSWSDQSLQRESCAGGSNVPEASMERIAAVVSMTKVCSAGVMSTSRRRWLLA